MKRLLISVVACACLFAGSAIAQEKARYLVTTKGPVRDAVRATGGAMIHEYSLVSGAAIEIPSQALEGIRRNPNVIAIEPDIMMEAVASPAAKPPSGGKPPPPPPPAQTVEWNILKIDAQKAWINSTGAGVKVAVIDTGIDKTHPDLAANIAGGRNFVRKGSRLDPDAWSDDNGHGTHVAGIIAAVNNTIGVVGVAPDAKLYAVKVLNSTGSGFVSDIIAGIEWSVANDMAVINMSLGASTGSSLLADACQAAANDGLLIVAAAGNDGGPVIYPARYDSVIAVGATDSSNVVPSWSNKGAEVEVVAPGVSVLSAYKGGQYKVLSGTSMATPHVAGICALMLGMSDPLPPANPRATLDGTADDLYEPGRDSTSGYGLADAEEAVLGAQTAP